MQHLLNCFDLSFEDVSHQNVWCPTTENSTWIAKRDGTMFITGNSRVQGK